MNELLFSLGTIMDKAYSQVTLGEWIKRERSARGYSMRALADLAGISHVSIDKVERGGSMRDSTLEMVVKALAGPKASAEEVSLLLGSAKAAKAGMPDPERVITDEEWELVQAYRGVESRMQRSFKDLLVSAVEVTGDEPKEELVFGRGPRKPLQ